MEETQEKDKDDDVVFVYESRILVPATSDEKSSDSYIFTLTENEETSNQSSVKLEEASVNFIPENRSAITIDTNTNTEADREIAMSSTSRQNEQNSRTTFINLSDYDSDTLNVTKKKRKVVLKPLVVLKKLPNELCITDSVVNVANNPLLCEFLKQDQNVLNTDFPISIHNLALHGETSTSKRTQRLSLKKITTRKITRAATKSKDITVDTKEGVSTYCLVCDTRVVDLKTHKKEHIIKNFLCDVCGIRYSYKTHLSQHFIRKHRQVIFQ